MSWRDRELLSIVEVAEVLSASTSHVRRHFKVVHVAGLARVRVIDVLEALGEANPTQAEIVALPRNRDADRIAARIMSRRA